ncbi:sensor histidine kinase [Pseudonocardia humida]|uniref:histidine kinase n=1 Tax=Pseudonocardia humida TaxID=2800819 RepID=A0ABT1A797_9PSEU|nr:histidine kinase [Pseudonocardia humida]MCO1658835.1 sensor histidine kinase [Pseudonocardia humida]
MVRATEGGGRGHRYHPLVMVTERAVRTERAAVAERLGRALRLLRSPLVVDVALVVALTALAVASEIGVVAPAAAPDEFVPGDTEIVVRALALTGPLLLRRRFPCAVLAISAAHFVVYWAVGLAHEVVAWLVVGVAVFSAAAYGVPRWARVWVAAASVTTTLGLLAKTVVVGGAAPVQVVVFAANNALPYVLGWSLGLMTRRLREGRAELEERNRELGRERERNTRRAVLEERVHIARELHDVVAHHVAVMGIQAGVAHRLFDAEPAEARAAVAAVQAGSRQVITELQQLLGMLREHDDAGRPGREPAPGLDQLPDLVASVRRAGLPVELVVLGGPAGPGLELSAFRIVQEALTNSLKHAGAAAATVTVRCVDGAVEVEVLDDGRGPAAAPGRGRGLTGMRERVGLHGGRLEVGARAGGGFRVHAVLGRP